MRSDPFFLLSHVPALFMNYYLLAGSHLWDPMSELRRSERSAVISSFCLLAMQVQNGLITANKRAYTFL